MWRVVDNFGDDQTLEQFPHADLECNNDSVADLNYSSSDSDMQSDSNSRPTDTAVTK